LNLTPELGKRGVLQGSQGVSLDTGDVIIYGSMTKCIRSNNMKELSGLCTSS